MKNSYNYLCIAHCKKISKNGTIIADCPVANTLLCSYTHLDVLKNNLDSIWFHDFFSELST